VVRRRRPAHPGDPDDLGGSIRTVRSRLPVLLAALALGLAACDPGDDELQPPPVDDPAPDDEPDDDAELLDEDVDTEPAPGDDPADGDDVEQGAQRLQGEPTTEGAETEGETGTLAVTDVRVATHDGFDRIVFETGGDGVPGWFVDYGEATAQGSGEPVEVAGDVTLRVSVTMVTLPPDLPDDLTPWDAERLDGPVDGVVQEIVEDTIFEGHHAFFVGLDAERPFLVERFEDPHRVVVDVLHEDA
jgi:hypothetical protein